MARALTGADLNGVSHGLVGLISVVVPERGQFLVAGPIGATLASICLDRGGGGGTDPVRPAPDPDAPVLLTILHTFGFSQDEAMYIERRLNAGAELVAITINNPEKVPIVRRLFADGNAVYISAARTDARVIEQARGLLDSPPEVYEESDVIVTDAVAQLRSMLDGDIATARVRALAGRMVVDQAGAEAGTIEDLLAEANHDAASSATPHEIRYVVIGFGGLLGIGRRYTVVPADQVVLDTDPVRVSVTRDVLQQAPPYDGSAPLSRREEHAICRYFGTTPYWAHDQRQARRRSRPS